MTGRSPCAVNVRQVRTEALEQVFERRDDENHQDRRDDESNDQYRGRVGQRFLDLFLDRLGLFLVGRDLVEQRFERTGLFARFYEVDEEIVEIERVFGKGLSQRGTTLDVGLDR